MGFQFVSTRGSPWTGSGKSGTPLSRMHWASLRAADCCSGAPLCAQGARWLPLLARDEGLLPHLGAHTDPIDEVARRVRVREIADAVGADALVVTALSRAVVAVVMLPPPLAVPLLVLSGAFEQPAPISATMARAPRAASGRRVFSPR